MTFPPSNFTVTPGSIVNVTPEDTTTLPVTVYGLLANVQVSSDEIVPETDVWARTGDEERIVTSGRRIIRNSRGFRRECR